ncbi:hypothetical protein LEP1GSC133_4849 [Leptospira borgpetersenii serovar Pomona str. 200901868]|uniref:Uncharacterized protein n=1 Tax=Leptospira borgpetersenii serovar Pomona str. 200901868 TaxID=1192866 RepID=M6WKF2_LEPBO|nr:hypothetical protein LEP1GSC133_4849 [Leptospira borgpetersenii serovar Pomona str. 200901868]
MDSLSVFKWTYCWNTPVGVPMSEVLGQVPSLTKSVLDFRRVKRSG